MTGAAALLVLLLAAWFTLHQPGADHEAATETRTVVRIIDGDTLVVNGAEDGDDPQRVRLLGINTPEVSHGGKGQDQCGGADAAAHLEQLASPGQTVHLITDARADDTDRYGRALRYVETEDGIDLGEQLITDGYAYAWAPASAVTPARAHDYETATDRARAAGTGAWASCPALDESR